MQAPSGKRQVIPTLVKIGNEYVKRQNMYDMETGERSVFDSEFDGSQHSGAFAPRERPVAPAGTAAAQPQPKVATVPREPREVSVAETRRMANNEALRAEKAATLAKRAVFFHAHKARIAHFVDAPVLASLAEAASRAPAPPARRPLLCQPEDIDGGEMRDYQLAGIDWLSDAVERCGLSPILGDEMGLGKTLQTIALMAHLKYTCGLSGACLVVCPLSVLSTWCAELKRWCGKMRVVKLHSSDPAERERLKANVLEQVGLYDVVVTTYEMAKSPAMRSCLVQKIHWRLLVLDEGHVIKNADTDISQTVRRMHFVNCVLLTGTPLQNNLTELWALLNFLYPEVFPSASVFDEGFSITNAKLSTRTLDEAHLLLQLLMIRRLKESVATALPPKLETLVTCPLAEAQLFWYRRLLLKDSSILTSVEAADATASGGGSTAVAPAAEAGGAKYKSLMNLLMQL